MIRQTWPSWRTPAHKNHPPLRGMGVGEVDNVIVPIQQESIQEGCFLGGLWMVFYGVRVVRGIRLINKGSEVDLSVEGFQG